ncbi:hypothetical protein ACFUYE_13365 [Micromonospora humida]
MHPALLDAALHAGLTSAGRRASRPASARIPWWSSFVRRRADKE